MVDYQENLSALLAEVMKKNYTNSWERQRYLWAVLENVKVGNIKKIKRRRQRKRRKARNMHRQRGFALSMLDNGQITEADFRRMFRMDRDSFFEIVARIDGIIQKDAQRATNSSGSPISNVCRLAVTLRWLAGASYLDLCWAWGVARGTFYSPDRGVLWPTIDALDELFDLGMDITNDLALSTLSDGFERHSGGLLKGCVMAIDGLLVRTRAPTVNEVHNRKDWLCRKGGFAMLCMAGADVEGRIVMATANYCGTTHDSTAWEQCALHKAMEEGRLPKEYFIIGDEAFACKEQVLCPYSGRGLGEAKDAFNYYLSHSRQCVERAFGMVIQRWGIMWRKFRFSFERWAQVIILCMKLHNFCFDRGDRKAPPQRYVEDTTLKDAIFVAGNDQYLPSELRQERRKCMCKKRFDITQHLANSGMQRPMHATCNSRA
jgi:hypothetical protein